MFVYLDLDDAINILVGYGPAAKAYFDLNFPWLAAAVISAFTVANTVRIAAYVPQIAKAIQDRNGASAISYATWGLFFFSHVTTIVYALVCAGDFVLAMIFLGNAAACLAIVVATLFNRKRHALRGKASDFIDFARSG